MTPADISAVLAHLSRLDTALGRVEEKQRAADEKQDEILVQVKATNGRVTAIERLRLIEEGASLQRAATIEDKRVVRATDIASKQWIKPAVVAVALLIADTVLRHYT